MRYRQVVVLATRRSRREREQRGLPLYEIEDLLPRSSAYRQAARILFPEPAAFTGQPLTPLHSVHLALCAVSGMLNGVVGSGKDLHLAAWQAVKVVDHSDRGRWNHRCA